MMHNLHMLCTAGAKYNNCGSTKMPSFAKWWQKNCMVIIRPLPAFLQFNCVQTNDRVYVHVRRILTNILTNILHYLSSKYAGLSKLYLHIFWSRQVLYLLYIQNYTEHTYTCGTIKQRPYICTMHMYIQCTLCTHTDFNWFRRHLFPLYQYNVHTVCISIYDRVIVSYKSAHWTASNQQNSDVEIWRQHKMTNIGINITNMLP